MNFSHQDGVLTILLILLLLLNRFIAMAMSVVVMERGTFLVAFMVAGSADFVASVGLLDHRALGFCHLHYELRVLGKLLVHPLHVKLATLFTFCTLAFCVARLDGWEFLASLHERSPRLWALGMTLHIFATCLMARASLLHHLVHLVPMLAVVLVMLIAVVAIVAVEFFMALMMARPIAEAACLVASMGLLKHWTPRFHHLHKVLRVLRKLLVHPLHFELGALVTLCILACCAACLSGRESLACFQKWGPWLQAP